MLEWITVVQLMWLAIACIISFLIGKHVGAVFAVTFLVERGLIRETDLYKLDDEEE